MGWSVVWCLSLLKFLFLVAQANVGEGLNQHELHERPNKLFVFGDSYADTGNTPQPFSPSWKKPYGITFPGKPTGRFSDGFVLTDYLASSMGIGSPVPYEEMKQRTKADEKSLKNGINFAFGGTGVFTTIFILPNMTTQIDFFQELIEENVYTKHDLNSSIALVSLAGNDYTTYMAHNGTQQGLPAFTKSVIKQLSVDLMRIHDLGVRNIGVTAMEPLGCLPTSTAFSSYKKCNQTDNTATKFHNHILQQAVQKLRNQNKDSNIVILDLYSAFMSVLKEQKNHPGTRKFVHPLRPCCLGVSEEYSCGSVSNTGAKKYVVCDNPKLSFFWDHVHPSHQGWHAIYSALGPCLYQLY